MQKNLSLITKTLENLGISALNAMQLASVDAGIQGNDMVLLSPTGSGKTLGYLLPLLHHLDIEKEGIQALIIAPSRELAVQIEQVFRKMGTGHKVNCCYGGHPLKVEKNNLLQPPAVLVGTPGRIADHLKRNSFSPASIGTVVLDEFDKSLEFGFQEEMSSILNQLKNVKRRILTSATEALEIPDFTGITSPVVLNYLEKAPSQSLTVKKVVGVGNDKLDVLMRLIGKLGNEPTLVFCNHREAVERISGLLWDKGVAHGIFHGGMEQVDRERALIKFRNGSHHLLITTDLASRGLDIPEIKHIVHYQLPTVENVYIHRNGRTARMNALGSAYLVLSENEHPPKYLQAPPAVEELPASFVLPSEPRWVTLYIGGGKKDKINKTDIVGLLLQKGQLMKDDLGLIDVLDHTSYVAVNSIKVDSVARLIKNQPIKKKKLKIEISR
jgi:superfamily II DNA/RNA helicase